MASTVTETFTKALSTVVSVSYPNGISQDASRQGLSPETGPVTYLANIKGQLSITYNDKKN